MATILIVTANPLLDHLADLELEPGRINRCHSYHVMAGGKGLNVGRVLVRHGHRVLACGFAGGYTGTRFNEIVAAEGQTPIFIPTTAPLRIGFFARNCVGAGPTGLLEDGFAVSVAEAAACIDTVTTALAGCDLCICSGSVPDKATCNELYSGILERCAQANVPCWVDSYGAAMDAALACDYPPTLVKPNREERERARGWERALERHFSDGSERFRVSGLCGDWVVEPPPVVSVNPIGSGDCYLGALAHARLSGWGIEQQLRYAAAAGALNATRMSVAELEPSNIAALTPTVHCTQGVQGRTS
jgi:fructose-1-phosphate kinase PfkB-like protein